LKLKKIIIDVMAFRNMACTPQVIDLASEWGQAHGGRGDVLDQSAQHAVRVVGNATSFGLSDMRSYYDGSMNHQHQLVHNAPLNLGVDSGFVFASTMHNPCISSTSMNRYSSHAQSFAPGNLPLPIDQVPGSMDEGGTNNNVGESARGHIKRKNAAVAGSYHFVNGFTGPSSSSDAPQNHALRPWDPSFESNVPPNIVPFNPSEYHGHNGWSSIEGSSVPGTNGFNSVVRPEPAQHGNYTFPGTHIGHAWMSQAANGVADGVPYVNAASNAQGN
jgi:E3 ubiquitin-protein ligase RNF38/44